MAGRARAAGVSALSRLPPEVNRVLFVRNLPYKITSEEMYDIFGKFGAIRQIRLGNTNETRGTAFVVYEDIFDAKNACEHLSGFNVGGRYLVVLYFQPSRGKGTVSLEKQKSEVEALRAKVAAAEARASGGGEMDLDDESDRRMMRA